MRKLGIHSRLSAIIKKRGFLGGSPATSSAPKAQFIGPIVESAIDNVF
jgi:hypothetical protein